MITFRTQYWTLAAGLLVSPAFIVVMASAGKRPHVMQRPDNRFTQSADVGYRQCRGVDPPMGVVTVHQHVARLADGGRPKARSAAVGGAYVERNTGNAERGVGVATRDRKKACTAVLTIAGTRPELLTTLNSYGYNNRTYTLPDLCPFTNK